MNKVITIQKAIRFSKDLKKQNKKIVLVGGCFDILHLGHITFLEKAKNKGDILMILLESDENIKHLKGERRPLQSQEDRGRILAAIECVDYVIPLPHLTTDIKYDELIFAIKPDIIATTKGDPFRHHKERQSKHIGATVYDIVERLNLSTSRIAKVLGKEI